MQIEVWGGIVGWLGRLTMYYIGGYWLHTRVDEGLRQGLAGFLNKGKQQGGFEGR